MKFALLGVLAGTLVACGGSDLPALTDATSLECPAPGALPFRLMSSGFQTGTDSSLAVSHPRIKDEASDAIGNPGGAAANIYLPDEQTPDATPIAYHGAKARTTATGGVFSTPLVGEYASLWWYDSAAAAWQAIGRAMTGSDGYYDLPDTDFVAPNGQPIYSVLEADGSCAAHYDYLFPAGEKFVVTDIDGTLTTSDSELIMELGDENYVPAMMTAAATLMQTWAGKGYPIVYLTARPHIYRAETYAWLESQGFPLGPVITTNGTTTDAGAYKTIWLERMITDFGWNAIAAYGNAITDITAYGNAGIPLDHTFIIGGVGASSGTVAIPNNDYTEHIATFVVPQPDNN